MNLYLKGIKTNWNLFHFNRHFVFFSFVILFFIISSLLTQFFLLLDYLLFPGFRKIKVKKPVFIIGHPRSGTTFIHQLFSQTDETAAFKAWHILLPSISQRKLFKPLIRHLIRKNKDQILPEESGHGVALDQVEEEEMLFIHNRDTQFVLLGTILGFDKDDFRQLRFHDLQPKRKRIRSATFLKRCFQRQIYYTGKTQIFAQTHFSTHRILTLLEVFPDAKFIYMHRTPYETLPSYFSLNYKIQDLLWGLDRFTKQQIAHYFEQQYQASRELYYYFHDLWFTGKIDKEKVLIVPYDSLFKDVTAVYQQIADFTGIETSPHLREAVAHRAKKQLLYKRGHEVFPLSRFGIDENRIKNDFAFIFEKDLLPGQPTSDLLLLKDLDNSNQNKCQADFGNESAENGIFQKYQLTDLPIDEADADIL